MPNNNNRINFQVGYNVDQASVNAVKKSLQDLQNIKVKDFSGTKTQLDQIKQVAGKVESALTKAFNVNLNSLNTQQFNASLKEAGLSVDKIYTSFSKAGAQGQVAFSRMASEVLTTNMQLKQTNSLVSQMGETMANTVKWGIASSIMNNFTNSVQQAFQYVKSLDSALTDIRIVTGDSTEQMKQFAVEANNAAQSLGRSTMDYTKAALTFYQQGLNDEDVQARTEAVLKAQNITGAGQEMADYLTAVWNGYKVANEEAELYVDKLASVADSSASNMSQLAIAMSKVASTANAMGVDVDQLNAQIATIVATTRQAPESVGNALKTIYSRINDISTGAEDAEISLGNYSSKMLDVGISVLDANGNLRDTGEVIEEIGGKWSDLSREQQIYLARTMAGQRQYNNLIALFDNWSRYSDLVNVSMESQGTLVEKNSRYMESLGAKMEQLGAAGERVKSAMINEEDLKGLVDFGTGAVNLFGSLIQSIGGGRGALLAFGSIFTQVFSGTIAKELNNVVTNIQNAHNNAQILANDIKNTQEFGQSKGYQNGTITAMVDAKKAAQQYYDFMSNAQKNEYNEIVKQIGASQDEVTILKEKIDLADRYQKALQNASQRSGEDFESQFGVASENLEELIISLQRFNSVKKMTSEDNAGLDELYNNFINLSNTLDSSTIPHLEQIKNLYKDIKQGPQANQDWLIQLGVETQTYQQKLQSFLTLLRQAKNQAASGLEYTGQRDSLSSALEQQIAKLQIAKQKGEAYLQTVKQYANVKTFVNMAAGVGQLASAITNLKNIGDIWDREDLTNGQKMLQTITNMSMSIPMLVNGLSQVIKGFKVIGPAIKTAAASTIFLNLGIKDATASEIAATAGTLTLSQALTVLAGKAYAAAAAFLASPLGAFVVVAAGVAAGIYGIYKAWNQENEAAQKAAQTAQKVKETYEDLKSTYEDLKSSLEDYNSAQEAIAEMTKGTQEWRDAIRESNDAVLDLIQSYPELASAVKNVNGQLVLSESIQQEALQRAAAAVDNARLASITTANNSRDASLRASAREASRFITTRATSIGAEGQTVTVGTRAVTTDQVMAVIKAYSETTAKSNQEYIAAITKSTGMQEQLVSAIVNNTENIGQLSAQYKSDQEATKLAYEAMASERLQDNTIYKGLDDLGKQITDSLAGANLQARTEQIVADIESRDINRFTQAGQIQDILDRYNKATNQDAIFASNAVTKGGIINLVIDGESVSYSKQQIANQIAAAQALQELGASAKQAAGLLSEIDKVGDENTSNAIKNFIAGGDFNNLTRDQLLSLGEIDITSLYSQYEESFKALGYKSEEAFTTAFYQAKESDLLKFDVVSKNYLDSVQKAYSELGSKKLTLGAATSIAKSLNQAFLHGGQEGLNSLQKVLSTMPSDKLEDFSSILQNIDWTQDGAAYQLQKAVEQQGIAVGSAGDAWDKFIDKLDQVSSKSLDAASAIDQLRGVASQLKDLEPGKILDDQAYDELIKQKPELEEFFRISDDGYMFIGTQEQVAETLKETTQQTINDLKQMQQIATQIKNKNLSEKASNIDLGQRYKVSSEDLGELSQLTQDQAFKNALSMMGITQEAFNQAQAYIEQHSGERRMSESMKAEYDEAKQVVQQALDQIVNLQANAQDQTYQNALRQAQQLTATRAQSLEELRNLYYEEQILLEDYGDMREVLIQDQLDRLDITREQYDATYEELREHLKQTSDSFNELSEAEQEVQLDQLTSRVYDLGDALDQLKGISSDTFDNIQQLIDSDAIETPEFFEQIGQLQAALQGIFQTDIDPSFIVQNFDLIRQLAQGDITALDDLQIALARDYTAKIAAEADLPSAQGAVDNFNAFLDTVDLQDLETGITLDDAGFTTALQEFANLAGLTADDINQILASIGFEPEVTEQQIPFDETNASQHGNTYTYTYTLPEEAGGGTNVITMTSEDYDAAASSGFITVPIINGKKIKYSGGSRTGSYARPSMSTPKSSGGGKGGGGGGGSKAKKPTTVKPQKLSEAKDSIEDRSDIYHDINLALDKQEDKLDDIQKEQKKLVNRDRLKNLQQQNKELEKQKNLLDQKSGIAATELVRLRNELVSDLGNGIKFDQNGQIANYNKALDQARDNYNDAIADYNKQVWAAEEAYNKYVDQYNSMSGQAQEANKAELDKQKDIMDQVKKSAQKSLDLEKEKYDAIKDNIKEYDDTLKLQRDIANQQQQIQDKIYENLIAMSKIKVDLSIDTGEFERDWLDFENKFIKKLDKDDFLGSAKASAKELMSYFNSKQIQNTAEQIKKIRNEINIMNQGGTSQIYGNNLAQAQEDLEDYMKQQMDDLEDIQDLVDDIKDNYLDALDNAKDKMDDQIDQYERVNDLIEHNVKLTQLLYGDKAYNTMDKYYELQKANNKDQLQSLRMQQQYWQNLMKNQTEHSPAWEEMKKNLDDVTDDLNSKLEDMIQNLSDQWQNRVDGIIARLNNALTGGRGLDYLDEQWDYINNFDDNFLDTFESKMGIQEVTDLYQQAIDGLSGSPAQQQKINKLMNEQLKILREKDNLTQYDIDRAKAALEVEKARMALEDARYNKTKMRLRRDSQGNYTYQYVADEQKLGDLQAALADAQVNLYNMDKEHYTQNLNTLYDAYKDYIEKMRDLTKEYNSTQDAEERARIQARIDLLRQSTNNLMQGLTEDNKYALQYLNESFFGGMGIDTTLLSTDEQMEIMTQNIPQMQSNIQDLANTIVGEGGILNATNDAMKTISDATVEYDANVRQFLTDAGSSLEVVTNVTDTAGNALDKNIQQANDLITTNQKLIDECNAQVDAIQKLLSWLDQFLNKVMNVQTLISNLRSAYGTGQQLNGSNLTADQINVESMGLDTTAGMNFTGNPKTDAAAVKQEIDRLMAQYEKFLTQMSIATFDTGGSTGSWGDAEGRLAFLHEKELVLNQQDTANILAAVEAVRMITSSLNGLATGEIGSLINNATGLLGGVDNTSTLDQNVHIEANFPNVTQHTEIEQAFNNLVNMASMRASGYRD